MSTIGKDLTKGNIRQILIQLTLPMIFGILSIIAFNLADTYFLGKLGTLPMAALTFTFPVVTVINSINLGIGIGTSAVVSRAVGTKDADRVKRLSTDSLTLGVIFSIIAVIIGEQTIYPLFTALGAGDQVMPYIASYMRIWYAGAPFIVIPMIGNSAIRALGDTKTPSIVMFCSAITNIILDPLLIFGFGPIPSMGVQGAAIATVFSRGITFLFAMYVLAIREKVVSFKGASLEKILASWKTIIYIGVPNAIARMIVPVGGGLITGLISGFGYEAVAGFGIATRLEFLALAVVGSLASVIPVFVGQNFGAGNFDRIKEGLKMSQRFALIYGGAMFILLYIFARPLGMIFTKEVRVIGVVVTYMRIVPLGYAFMGILQILTSAFNALHKPIHSAFINLIQMMGIYVPLAMVASPYIGIRGIFMAMVLSYFVVTIPSYRLLKYLIKKEELKVGIS